MSAAREKHHDSERQYTLLQRSLKAHNKRWGLYLLKYDHGTYRNHMAERLASQAGAAVQLLVDEQHFPDWSALEQHLAALPADTPQIQLTGMDTWLSPERARQWNLRREPFIQLLHCPFLVWLTPASIAALAHEAPDLWDWRTGIFDFCHTPEEARIPDELLGTENFYTDRNFDFSPGTITEGQLARIEELSKYLRINGTQSARFNENIVNLYNELAFELIATNRGNEAIEILRQHISNKRLINKDQLAISYRNLGLYFIDYGSSGEALIHLKNAQHIFDSLGSTDEVFISNLLIIHLLIKNKKLNRALTLAKKTMGLSETETQKIQVFKKMAECQENKGRIDFAVRIYYEIIKFAERNNDFDSAGYSTGQIANIALINKKNPREAINLYKEALVYYTQGIDVISQIITEIKIGIAHIANEDIPSSLPHFISACKLSLRTGDDTLIKRSLKHIAIILDSTQNEDILLQTANALNKTKEETELYLKSLLLQQ